ncbi:ELWxxDGT repeat protein [Lacipirellula parvula]|uniref:ELWxxDGT repeat protein n=1 Tax=Lacipirellula parvula TaxID=2650471 RepID=UPI00156243AF|nr:ELWxxDGT repeat protein [Lacipirellula parvula]
MLSVTVEMLTDIGSMPQSGDSNPYGFVEIGELTYFRSRPSSFEPEQIWVTNGTTNATRRLSELLPGNLNVSGIAGDVAGKLYFFVSETIPFRYTLWQWEGFGSEPTPVLDANGQSVAAATSLTEVDGVWYFGGGAASSELWRTDGTQAGTFRVKTIRPDGFASFALAMFNANGTLFFSADDGTHGRELWKSDGTEAGTVLVKDINPGSSGAWSELADKTAALVGDVLYFGGNDPTGGAELWRSDGTEAGTFRVKDIAGGTNSSNPKYLTNIGGVLYFTTSLSDVGLNLLWKSDGTEAGTTAIPFGGSTPFDLTEFHGALYFGASGALWRSDGTTAGTQRIGRSDSQYFGLTIPSPLHPGSTLHRDNIVNFNGTLYFLSGNSAGGTSLWKLAEGEANATYVFGSNTPPPPSPSSPIVDPLQYLTVAGDKLYFAGRSSYYGIEPWVSDGTVAGTRMLKDITGASSSSEVGGLINANGTLRFFGSTGTTAARPRGLWSSDGTIPGTTSFVEIGGRLDHYSVLGVAGGFTFFKSTGGNANDWELWRTDGTAAGTLRVKDIRPGVESSLGNGFSNAVEMNGFLYFHANDGAGGFELWRSDGTEAGTTMVADVASGAPAGFISGYGTLANVGGTLYFVGNDGVNGYALWKTDGTSAGTSLVRGFATWPPANLFNANGTLYFCGGDSEHGFELWTSDGTTAGTLLVRDIGPGHSLSPTDSPGFVNIGDTLYFAANDGTVGWELWRSDGAADGTQLVKDIRPDGGSAFTGRPRLTVVGNTVYFFANDGALGEELWKSDGTEAGTVLVKDIQVGPTSSQVGVMAEPVNVNGILYFAARTSTTGVELWRSDGTDAGTYMVRNLNTTIGGAGGSDPALLTNINGLLYFIANDGVHGQELWVARPEAVEPLAGDYNNDGRVDGADFLAWQRGYGSAATPAGSGADGDGDGAVGASDLDVWKNHFGSSTPSTAASSAAVAAFVAPAITAADEFEIDEFNATAAAVSTTEAGATSSRLAARDALFAAGDFSRVSTIESATESWGVNRRRGRTSLRTPT